MAFVTQAIAANFAPLLFLTFKETYGILLNQIALIPFVFYFTQLLVDTAATKFADKIGYRTCACCYLLALLSTPSVLGWAGCALCGLAVGIMWPGTISISSQKCPRGGTAMFAFLALAGDLGAAVSPTMVGKFSEMSGGNLKVGLLIATVFPIILFFGLIVLNKVKKR